MTTQSKTQQSLFPDLPRASPVINSEGNFTDLWSLGISLLFQALQVNFKNEGILFPPLTSTQMASIASLYTAYINKPLPQNDPNNLTQNTLPDISGQTCFDSTNRIPSQFVITYDASSPPKVSTAQWMKLSLLTTSSGNPNGQVGGALNWFCYDTVGQVLYACTTAGSANGTPAPQAVWTTV
jgi:hypothetical protein